MKNIISLFLVSGIIYLSSCSNGGNDSIAVTPAPDSTSKGSSFFISIPYRNDLGASVIENDSIYDYIKNNVVVYALFANAAYNASDSLWHLKLQVLDQKIQKMELNITAINTAATGNYTITTNNSTVSFYKKGKNYDYTTYSVLTGSTVNITQSSYPVQGTMDLHLCNNHDTIPATGSFKIFY